MKRGIGVLALAVVLVFAFTLAGCGEDESADDEDAAQTVEETGQDPWESKTYSKEDFETTKKMVEKCTDEWGCTIKTIRYGTDKQNNKDNLEWLNQIQREENEDSGNYKQCIEIIADIKAPKDAEDTAWEAGRVYEDYQFWFARAKDGNWELVTYGY